MLILMGVLVMHIIAAIVFMSLDDVGELSVLQLVAFCVMLFIPVSCMVAVDAYRLLKERWKHE